MVATTLQIIVLLIFITYLINKFGVLPSLSNSTYTLRKEDRYYFTFVIWTIALLNYFQPMEMYGALASGMLFFTGATIVYKNDYGYSRVIHYTSAVLAIVFTLIGLYVLHGFWLPTILILILSLPFYIYDKENIIWWSELVTFSIIFLFYYLI